MPRKISDDQWFSGDRYTISDTECWVWNGCLQKDGYGSCNRRLGQSLAHRAFYIFFCGPVPEGMEIDHTCRNRACVNPDHMEAVTHQENVARSVHVPDRHRNGKKTHCKRGHAFDAGNTVWEQAGERQRRKCRTCRNEAQNDRYARKKKAA